MRPLLLLLVVLSSAAHAQPAGWTVESRKNGQNPAAYAVVATRALGQSKLVYERSMLNGINYRVEHDGCSSSSGGAGGDSDPAAHLEQVTTAITGMVRDKDNFCKLPPAAAKGLLVGLGSAIAAADAAYVRDRPTITVQPRTASKDGWTIEDTPGEAYEGLVSNHIFKLTKAAGPVLISYTLDLPLSSSKVSDATRQYAGKVRDCDYANSDYGDFVSTAARAKALRTAIAGDIAATGCQVTDPQVATALAGFDAAYAMLDGWAVERLDERRMLLEAANASADGGSMDAAAAMAADAVESAPTRTMAECAIEQPDGKVLPGC